MFDVKILDNYKNGTYLRIVYKSYPEVRSAYNGRVMKVTQGVFRSGIEYVSENKEVFIKPKTNQFPKVEYIKDNLIAMVTKKDLSTSIQVVLRDTKNHKHTKKSIFLFLNDNNEWIETTKEKLVEMDVMTQSMAKSSNSYKDYQRVKVDNILAIGKGCGLDTI